MTIQELIAILEKYPLFTEVMVQGYEGGFESPGEIELVNACYQGKSYYMGDWEEVDCLETLDEEEKKTLKQVLLIHR